MVIDASVGVKWIVPEDDTEIALRLLDLELHVPALFHSEVANALWKKAVRREIEVAGVLPELSKLVILTSQLDDAQFVARALEIAADLVHPVYDCVYLAVAEALNTNLVTADNRFLNRVKGTVHQGRVMALAEFGSKP